MTVVFVPVDISTQSSEDIKQIFGKAESVLTILINSTDV
jgi:hypothetical protein